MAMQEELKRQGDFLFRYRSYLPVALLAAGLCVKVYQERFNGLASESLASELLEGSALLVGLIGLLIRIITVGFSPRNTSGRNTNAGQIADVLNTTGAYSVTRNPLYVGNYCMWIAVAMATGSAWFVVAFSLVFWLYYERIIFAEETFLRGKFGNQYLDWAARTPPFLPAFANYVAPNTSFSWRKVLRQEKNGLFALFFLLCLFGLVGDLAEGELSFREERRSLLAAALAGVAYVLLKVLKELSVLSDQPGHRDQRYGEIQPHSLMAKTFHWGFIALFVYGLIRQVDEVDELGDTAFLLEEAIFAATFLVLLLVRFVYMRSTRPSALPDDANKHLRLLARTVHLGLYASLALLALTGLLIGGTYASGLSGTTGFALLLWSHEASYWAALILIALHVVAAINHRFLGDGIWSSMVPVLKERTDGPGFR